MPASWISGYPLETARSRYDSLAHGRIDLAAAPERVILDIRRREMGYVSQFLRVIPRVSAVEVIMEPILARNDVSPEEARGRAEELLDRLRIPRRLFSAYPATFSGGEQQRVNIARAVAWKPRLLLVDEPTASLDADSITIVLELLRELQAEGTTMVGIFHDPEVMRRVATTVVHLEPEGALCHA